MHIDQLYPSRFLRCADLNGQPMRVTVEGLKREDIGGESKVVLTFTNGGKAMVLNKTNAKAVAKAQRNKHLARQGHRPRPGAGRLQGRHRRRHSGPSCITAGGAGDRARLLE